MKKLLILLTLAFTINVNAQDDKTVTLVVSGQGKTQDEARQKALRSAIEQAFGTFISSKTEILNDNLVKDEIVSVSNGNIQKYDVISAVQIPDGGYATTLKATVSVSKLTSFCESKGISIEFKGSLLALNLEQQNLNEKNELKSLISMNKICKDILNKSFNYKIYANEPIMEKDNISLKLEIEAKFNSNIELMNNYLLNTIKNLSMSESEIEAYKKLGKPIYKIAIGPCNSYLDTTYTIYAINGMGPCGTPILKTNNLKEFEKAKKKYPVSFCGYIQGKFSGLCGYSYVKTPNNCNVKYVFRSHLSVALINDIIFYTFNALFNFKINTGQQLINGESIQNCFLNKNPNLNCNSSVQIIDYNFAPILTGGQLDIKNPKLETTFATIFQRNIYDKLFSTEYLKNLNTDSKLNYRLFRYESETEGQTIQNRLDYHFWNDLKLNQAKEYEIRKSYNFLSLIDLDIPCEQKIEGKQSERYFTVISLAGYKNNNAFKIIYDFKTTINEIKKINQFEISTSTD
jgi:hypothetical protein